MKNPKWQEANQLAIYKRSRGVDPRTTLNKSSLLSERDLNRFMNTSCPVREQTRSNVEWRWAERERARGIYTNQEFIARQCYIGLLWSWSRNRGHCGCKPCRARCEEGWRQTYHVLSPIEQSYSQTGREALAIRWACERLRMYLAGARFKVVTDHKPLDAIFSYSNSKPPVRIERWSTYLQEFNFTVEYRPGKENPEDYRSRRTSSF